MTNVEKVVTFLDVEEVVAERILNEFAEEIKVNGINETIKFIYELMYAPHKEGIEENHFDYNLLYGEDPSFHEWNGKDDDIN